MKFSVAFLAVFAVAVQAAPFAEIEKRSTTCGSTFYSTAQINAAANAACNHYNAGTTAGGSTYPHRYNNYEGFNFASGGPWQTFPLRTSGTYNGGECFLQMPARMDIVLILLQVLLALTASLSAPTTALSPARLPTLVLPATASSAAAAPTEGCWLMLRFLYILSWPLASG